MFFSQGIGPVESKWGRFLMKIANRVDLITVRDQYSKDLLHELGVNRPKSIVTSDIVFAFQPKRDNACIESLPLTGDEQLVAVSMRPWFERKEQFQQTAEALDRLIEERDITPVFVPMEGHHDTAASKEVLNRMKHSNRCFLLENDFTPNQYLNFIGECQMTISMRLHALVFSTIQGVPHIGLSYDKKVENLLKRNGMWDYSFVLEEIDVKQMIEHGLYLLDHQEENAAIVRKNAEDLRKEAHKNIALLREYFYSSEK